jgi:lysophospholipase L1-like esterase
MALTSLPRALLPSLQILSGALLCSALWMGLSSQSLAEDWAQTSRYAADNARLRDSGMPVEVVIIGDSIVETWVSLRPHFFRDTGFVGRGTTSQTTPQMLVRFRQDIIALQPAMVVIHAGTNDIAGNGGPLTLDDTLGYIQSMAELASAAGIAVLLTTLLPAAEYPWNPGQNPRAKITALNTRLATYAEQNNYRFVNFFSVMTDGNNALREAFSNDGVHPNALGYSAMERRLEAAVLERRSTSVTGSTR